MTGRDKVLAAFSESGTGEIPVMIPYEGIYMRDRWDELTSCPWYYQLDTDIDKQLQWRREIWEWVHHDFVGVYPYYGRDERDKYVVESRPDGVYRINRSTGVEKEYEKPAVGGYDPSAKSASINPLVPADTGDELDKLIYVSPDEEIDAGIAAGSGDMAAAIFNGYGVDLCPMSHVSSPLWSCYDIWGFEGMMTRMLTDPDLVHYACKRFRDKLLQDIKSYSQIGTQVIWIEECCMDQISPDIYRSLCLPYLRDVTDAIRGTGLKSIHYFTGAPGGKWDILLDTGADALSLEESKKGFEIDIEDVVDLVKGRMTLLGNLDTVEVLERGSETTLRAEMNRQISAGRRNGSKFIMSLGCPVTPDTTPERVRLYCDLTTEISSENV